MTTTVGRSYSGLPVVGLTWVRQFSSRNGCSAGICCSNSCAVAPVERHLVPDEARRRGYRAGTQPRRIAVVEVGHDQHRRGMLEKAVGHLLQREADVLEADFLADDVERHRSEAAVHRAHARARARCRRRRRHRRRAPPAGAGVSVASSIATRWATTHFSEQVLTNIRYFCRLSKKRKLRSPAGSGSGLRLLPQPPFPQAGVPTRPEQTSAGVVPRAAPVAMKDRTRSMSSW